MSKKLWGYARVSIREQNLERQLFELKKYVKPEDIFADFQSGKDFDRLQYKKLKEEICAGDELYVKSIDRLGHNNYVVQKAQDWINGLPQRIFGYRTSEELFNEQIALLLSAA